MPSISSLSREPTDVEKMTRAGCGAPRGEAGPAVAGGRLRPPGPWQHFLAFRQRSEEALPEVFQFPRPRYLAGEPDSLRQC